MTAPYRRALGYAFLSGMMVFAMFLIVKSDLENFGIVITLLHFATAVITVSPILLLFLLKLTKKRPNKMSH